MFYFLKTICLCLVSLGGFSNAGKLESILLNAKANSIISPLSIYSTLAPLQLGSDGITKDELVAFMRDDFYSLESDAADSSSSQILQLQGPQINSVTALFTSLPLAQKFIKITTSNTKTKVHLYENFNFTRNFEDINDLVRSSTNGIIDNIIQPGSVNDETKLIVLNAVHFKAKWRQPFEAIPSLQPFYTSEDHEVQVPMMTQRSSNYYAVVPELQSKIVEIPYENGEFVMRIILPDEKGGLEKVLQLLKTYDFSNLRLKLTEVDIIMPPFRISNDLDLDKIFKYNGLSSLFSPTSANLSKLTVHGRNSNEKRLFVDKLITKSVLDVSALGTEGGSSTAAFIIPLSGLQTFDEFVVDHPFMFQIFSSKSGSTIFSGTLLELPSAVSERINSTDTKGDAVHTNQPQFVRPRRPPPIVNNDIIKDEIQPVSTTAKTANTPLDLTQQLSFYQLKTTKSPEIESTDNNDTDDSSWWVHTGIPEYLQPNPLPTEKLSSSPTRTYTTPDTTEPRFQQPEPNHPTGIRFPFPLTDPTTLFVLHTHLRNTTTNAI